MFDQSLTKVMLTYEVLWFYDFLSSRILYMFLMNLLGWNSIVKAHSRHNVEYLNYGHYKDHTLLPLTPCHYEVDFGSPIYWWFGYYPCWWSRVVFGGQFIVFRWHGSVRLLRIRLPTKWGCLLCSYFIFDIG